jgi:NAD dependent epimerase/dehydratase family enzyme
VGGFAEAMLSGQWCVPEVLEQTGFDFEFPTLEKAFEEIFTRRH